MSPIRIKRQIEDYYGSLTKFSEEFDLAYNQLSDTIHNRRRDARCVAALNKIGITLPPINKTRSGSKVAA